MIRRENALIFMPHPRTKGSTGYPDAVKDTDHFRDDRYLGVGWRWGMGLDLSERRLSDYRVLPLLDDMNNWMAAAPAWTTTPKQILAITGDLREASGRRHLREQSGQLHPAGQVAGGGRHEPGHRRDPSRRLLRHLGRGVDSIVHRPGQRRAQRTIVADVEWTFPLEFVEVVWGDGRTTGRRIVPATELAAVWTAPLRDPVRGGEPEMGPLRRVGLGGQWSARPASQTGSVKFQISDFRFQI